MNSGSILLLGLCGCFHFSMINSEKCMNAEYEAVHDDTIPRKLQSECGILGYIYRALSTSNDDFDDLSNKDKQHLCACALYRRLQILYPNTALTDYHKLAIYNHVKFAHNSFNTLLNYLWFKPFLHPTEYLECIWGTHRIAILKSFTKKAFMSPQWDIYLATVDNTGKIGDFQGIIKNVDLLPTEP